MQRKSRFRLQPFVLFGVVALCTGWLIWFFFGDRVQEVIVDEVYRSNQLSPRSLDKTIDQFGIRTIINLRGKRPGTPWYDTEASTVEKHGVTLVNIDLSADELPDSKHLKTLINAITSEERPILVHCKRGVDRTGLASALSLLLLEDSSLDQVREQISFKYGVAPFFPSVGILLFDDYEQWLSGQGADHSRPLFLDWVEHEYLDKHGNVRFWVDRVNEEVPAGRKFELYYYFELATRPDALSLEGWIYDLEHSDRVEHFQISADGQTFYPVDVDIMRPRIRAILTEEYSLNIPGEIGWSGSLPTDRLESGCHVLVFKLSNGGGEERVVDSRFKVCVGQS